MTGGSAAWGHPPKLPGKGFECWRCGQATARATEKSEKNQRHPAGRRKHSTTAMFCCREIRQEEPHNNAAIFTSFNEHRTEAHDMDMGSNLAKPEVSHAGLRSCWIVACRNGGDAEVRIPPWMQDVIPGSPPLLHTLPDINISRIISHRPHFLPLAK